MQNQSQKHPESESARATSDWMIVFVIAHYTLREALRNRILWIAVVFAAMGVGLASFVGDIAVAETEIVEATLLAASYRFCAALVLMVLVISTLVREFNDKCLELYLSLTISRLIYYVGKMLGFVLAGALLAAVFGGMLLLYAPPPMVGMWALTLACELAMVAAVAVFCVMSFNQQIPASFAASLVFYLMCRASDAIVLIAKSPIIVHTVGVDAMRFLIEKIAYILPSLGRFAKSEWLAYGGVTFAETLPPLLLQTAIYVAFIGAATMVDFSRKNL